MHQKLKEFGFIFSPDREKHVEKNDLFGPPVKEILAPVDLFLELKKSIEQGLSGGRATRDINVNWHNSITPTNNRV